MKVKDSKPVEENPRARAVKRILSIAQLIRQRGSPDEASEALEWEKKLADRLGEIPQAEGQKQAA